MKCPNCGVQAPAGAADCAGCGVIFAKFKKKLELATVPVASTFNPWKGRAIAAAIVALWFVAFGLYYRRVIAEMLVRNPAGPARAR